MHLQYASCCCKLLMSWVSVSKTFVTSLSVVIGMGDGGQVFNVDASKLLLFESIVMVS